MSRFVNYTTRYYYVDEFDEDLKNSLYLDARKWRKSFLDLGTRNWKLFRSRYIHTHKRDIPY